MTDKVPLHIGIIPDGNRRWAEEKGRPSFFGHTKGAENIKNVIMWCAERQIKFLTLFVFSAENWQRSKHEVDFLMGFAKKFTDKNIMGLHRDGVRIRVLGSREGLSSALIKQIEAAEELTKGNSKITINFLFNYGGRAEIIDAVKKMAQDGALLDNLNEEMLSVRLYTAGLPEPDLIIRTSGEQRTSGFLMWQSVYSEWYFCQKYWPDFSESDLDEALAEYGRRKRRFGK